MNAQKAKQKLFAKYARNFNLVTKHMQSNDRLGKLEYVCPLCKRYFNIESLNTCQKNHLTIEHIPPKSVGGVDLILTCKECNNIHGSQLDSELDKKAKQSQFINLQEGAVLDSKFLINDEMKANGYVQIDDNKNINLILQESRTNPIFHENLKRIALGKDAPKQIKFRIKGYNKAKSNLSILRSAFLLAFKQLGYAFLLSENSEIPRKKIMEHLVENKSFHGIFISGIPDDMLGVNIIVEPQELNSYCVVVRVMNENYGVILPGSNKKCKDFYLNYNTLISQSSDLTISLLPVENHDYIEDEKYAFNPHFNWLKNENSH